MLVNMGLCCDWSVLVLFQPSGINKLRRLPLRGTCHFEDKGISHITHNEWKVGLAHLLSLYSINGYCIS